MSRSSANGDSGSAIVAKDTNDLVGLLVRRRARESPENEIAIACFAPRVFSNLKIALP